VRLAVVADTHLPRGRRRLSAACLRVLDRADLILHAGDFVTAGVLEELRQLAPVEAVHGNQDDAELQALLPARRVVEIAGRRIGMVHEPGTRLGREDRLAALFPGCALVVYGHTHVADVTLHGDTLLLNPGSPTERRRSPARTMAVVDVTAGGFDTNICSV
jgi:putative phosphoesterase